MGLMIFAVLPFLLALVAHVQGRKIFVPGAMAAMFVGAMTLLPQLNDGEVLTYTLDWVPDLGLSLSFYIDGLALLFVALVTFVGTAVFHYAAHYFDTEEELTRFYRWLLVFTGAMLWLVTAGNLLALFIAWELTSVSSFMLIGFKGNKYQSARYGASQALAVTGLGGLALVVGVLLIASAAGSMEYTDVLTMSLADHPYYNGIIAMIALAAFTKSAQFPFQFWLPGAMSAPSPASAFLHSATMVKAGVYLLARLYPTLGNTMLWENLLVGIGLGTFFIGCALALRHRDLKGILAYTTIAQLGTLVALIGLPDADGFKALMVGILGHALYKAPLFLSAGVVDHATGTRIIDKLGGLRKQMPALAVIVGLACVSMAGIIPMLGFVGKETLLEAFIDNTPALVVIVTGAVLMVLASAILFYETFIREPTEEIHFHEPSQNMLYGPGLLVATGSITGLILPLTIIPLITPAVPKEFSLYLFPGINTAFILSTFAIAAGLALFVVRNLMVRGFSAVPLPSGEGGYKAIVGGVEWFADQLLKTQNGKLRNYLVVIMGSVALLMLVSGILADAVTGISLNIELDGTSDLLEGVLVGIAIAATFGSIIFKNHLAAALSLGVMGYAVGGIFLLEPAPDVALVQFLVETLGTVLVVIMIGRISVSRRQQAMDVLWDTTRSGVWRDIAISVIVGLTVGLFALNAITNRPERDSIAVWHIENAYPLAGVTDVVAAILADFRATDTMLEIIVFSMAAIGVLTLLTLSQRAEPPTPSSPSAINGKESLPEAPSPLNSPLARMVARIVLPVAILISMTHLLYAGDRPGDGFTAGVISGLAVALWYVVFGYNETKQRLGWLRPWWLVGIGLTLALTNAVLPLAFGREFFALTKIAGFDAPAGLHIASTLIFEISIYLAVFGSASLIMESIAHPEGVDSLETQELRALQLQESQELAEESTTDEYHSGTGDGRDVRSGRVSTPSTGSD